MHDPAILVLMGQRRVNVAADPNRCAARNICCMPRTMCVMHTLCRCSKFYLLGLWMVALVWSWGARMILFCVCFYVLCVVCDVFYFCVFVKKKLKK